MPPPGIKPVLVYLVMFFDIPIVNMSCMQIHMGSIAFHWLGNLITSTGMYNICAYKSYWFFERIYCWNYRKCSNKRPASNKRPPSNKTPSLKVEKFNKRPPSNTPPPPHPRPHPYIKVA